ncbi:MAG: DNA-processing protein DprA [Patescibacteria group bacterium]
MIIKISYDDPRFPESVKNLINTPKVLSVLASDEVGKAFSWPTRSLAVIGSRNMSDYGKKVVWDFVPRLVSAGVTVVSGLAEGVDEEAQRAVLKAGGTTIGVLGFGILKIGDFSNKDLCRQIVESQKGFLVSPFDPYLAASKWTFLERNRFIAGLADALLVVEATQKSGCMSTVEAALELGKEVFVVPGSIFSYTSMGANELIKQGAHLVSNIDDIVF